MPPVSLEEIRDAAQRIASAAYRTPAVPAWSLNPPDGNRLVLKAENLQRTHSFKFRGAFNAVASLSPEERARGVITFSSGNHGQAVACAAHLLGVEAVIVMPEDAIPLKVESTRRWGASVEFAGLTSLARQSRAMELVAEHGYTVIPPFDDRRIIAGQGTVGLEIVEDVPDLAAVVVPVGGGGLVSGVSTAVKALRPDVRVIGVEPAGAADAQQSLREGHIVTWDTINTVADGLRTSRMGELNFATVRECVDEIVTVDEDDILRTTGLLARDARLIAEPSGAVAPAAVLCGKVGVQNGTVVAIISGGNIDPTRLLQCLTSLEHAAVS
jgi:threo-3-hydroxy-L-aspartate ammonia-lyase